MKEKVAIIGTNGLPARYGGFETLADHLTRNLKEEFEFVVYCSTTPKSKRCDTFNGAKLVYLPFRANGYQSVIYDIISIIHAWFTSDKLLILGHSGAMVFPFKVFARKKIVMNIGGIECGRNKWSGLTRKFLQFSEWLCVKFSDVIITDNKHIQKLCQDRYKIKSVLIEYGGDHVLNTDITQDYRDKYPFLGEEYALSVSRAESDNNIHMLLSAYERMQDKKLVIISNWEISEYGLNLKEKYLGKHSNIILLDAIYRQDELDAIRRNSAFYIHSHSLCGTAPSLVEAMNLELPIICYKAQTNIETTENKSIYFESDDELIEVVNSIDKQRSQILRKELKKIAGRRYTWRIIADKYADCLR